MFRTDILPKFVPNPSQACRAACGPHARISRYIYIYIYICHSHVHRCPYRRTVTMQCYRVAQLSRLLAEQVCHPSSVNGHHQCHICIKCFRTQVAWPPQWRALHCMSCVCRSLHGRSDHCRRRQSPHPMPPVFTVQCGQVGARRALRAHVIDEWRVCLRFFGAETLPNC
jgi:hypothetical protein